jgi:hypothetical protein
LSFQLSCCYLNIPQQVEAQQMLPKPVMPNKSFPPNPPYNESLNPSDILNELLRQGGLTLTGNQFRGAAPPVNIGNPLPPGAPPSMHNLQNYPGLNPNFPLGNQPNMNTYPPPSFQGPYVMPPGNKIGPPGGNYPMQQSSPPHSDYNTAPPSWQQQAIKAFVISIRNNNCEYRIVLGIIMIRLDVPMIDHPRTTGKKTSQQ